MTESGVKILVVGIPEGQKGETGKGFSFKKIFSSIAEMEAYTGTDVEEGEFVLISSTVEDPDNSKFFTRKLGQWNYQGDLSGAQGIQGVGIQSAEISGDGKLTLHWTDGNSYTTPISLIGPTGATGATGANHSDGQ